MNSKGLSDKIRQSNIELLRIVAMFLVLVVHADFWANDAPTKDECFTQPVSAVTRFLIESISIVCVDVFVLISGWFGIRPNVKEMSSFLFQCFFFLAKRANKPVYVILPVTKHIDISHQSLKKDIFMAFYVR